MVTIKTSDRGATRDRPVSVGACRRRAHGEVLYTLAAPATGLQPVWRVTGASQPVTPMDSPDDPADDGSITTLRVVWLDSPSGRRAFALDHPYIELVYTPLIGASAVLFLRRIMLLSPDDDEIDVDSVAMARELGLRSRDDRPLGRKSPFVKSLYRLEHHQLARWLGPHRLGVYRQAPALADAFLPNLPESARRIHLRYIQT